jgi:hypothetical protein
MRRRAYLVRTIADAALLTADAVSSSRTKTSNCARDVAPQHRTVSAGSQSPIASSTPRQVTEHHDPSTRGLVVFPAANLLLAFNAMAKTLIQNVVKQLERERNRLQSDLHRVSAALTAFGRAYLDGAKPRRAGKRRTMSAAGRRKIAAAQRARWAKVRARQKKSLVR